MSYSVQGIIISTDSTTAVPPPRHGTTFHTDNAGVQGVFTNGNSPQFHAGKITGINAFEKVPAKDVDAKFFVGGKPVEFVNHYHGPIVVEVNGPPRIIIGPGAK
jgi:hypothetical protein